MATRRRKRKSKKWISKLFFLLLLIVAVILCYFVWDAYFKDKGLKQPDSANQQDTSKDEKKEEKPEEKEEKLEEKPEEKPKVPQYDGDDPNTANDITGAITYVGVSNGYLRVRVNVDQYINGGGCNIILLRNSTQIYSDYANLNSSASTSTCEGFDIPVSEIGSGYTQIRITLSSGEKSGAITGEVTL